MPDPVTATERLAQQYSSTEARRACWRGAAWVRRQVANESQGVDRLRNEQLANVYEAREAEA